MIESIDWSEIDSGMVPPGPVSPVDGSDGQEVDKGVVEGRCLADWSVVDAFAEWTVQTPLHPAFGVISRIVRPYPAATIAQISLDVRRISETFTNLLLATRAVQLVRLEVLVRHLEELLDRPILRPAIRLEDEFEDGDVYRGEHDLELGDLWVGVRD